MLRSVAVAFGVAVVLLGSSQASTTVDPETAGFQVLELACMPKSSDDGSLRCVAEIERFRDDVGMLTAAWGLDGGYVATDAVTGSVTSWVLADPPSGEHVVHVAVVDPRTGFTVEATTDVEIVSPGISWPLWLLLTAVVIGVGAAGFLAWRRRDTGGGQARSCPACSSVLAEGDRFCPACGSAVTLRVDSFCSGCGNPIDPNDRFCPHCGRGLVTDRAAAVLHPPR